MLPTQVSRKSTCDVIHGCTHLSQTPQKCTSKYPNIMTILDWLYADKKLENKVSTDPKYFLRKKSSQHVQNK
jgi:hypothetical protein